MKIQCLNGIWSYRIGKGEVSEVSVPFCRLPVGHSECERYFDADISYDRVFLKFDGITYGAKIFFRAELTDDFTGAEFVAETTCAKAEGVLEISLFDGDRLVHSYTQPAGKEFLTQKISHIRLWSPDSPNLYRLEAKLTEAGKVIDEYICNIGFREFTCDRHRFYLNGEPLFLKGVCKHEMVGDSGHCPTLEQVRHDMQMIKDTGCNFVRLVHYPHGKAVLDVADEIGLMVSEEPGLWWSDVSDPEISNGSLEVLRLTILRDRNHPSIVFWLSFNECEFTEKFLKDSADMCRRYDSTRLVSGANCMDNETTKRLYSECGFDFYTAHPYAPTVDWPVECIKYLTDKPLLFTEWGGLFVYDNPRLLGEFMDTLYSYYTNSSDDGALAGAFLWSWADVYDFNRGRPACTDGVLYEGLMTYDRKPSLIYDAFCRGIERMNNPVKYDSFRFEPVSDRILGKNILSEGDKDIFDKLREYVNQTDKRPRKRELTNGPRLESNPHGLLNIPHIISDGVCVSAECDMSADKLIVAGLTSPVKGYPLGGEYSEAVACVCIIYADGSVEEYELFNGEHITTSFAIWKSSRINPVAFRSERYAFFDYGKDFDYYLINSFEISLKEKKDIKRVEIKSAHNGYRLLIYGIFV